jgi:hypothetical protein
MNTHKQKGIAYVLLIAFLVLISLSGIARCDIDQTSADEVTPHIKQPRDGDEIPSYPEYRYDPNFTGADRPGLRLAWHQSVQ